MLQLYIHLLMLVEPFLKKFHWSIQIHSFPAELQGCCVHMTHHFQDTTNPTWRTYKCWCVYFRVVMLVGEWLHLGRLRTIWRQLHLGLLGMLLHCEEPERAIAKGFCEGAMSSSSSVQQVQLACARSKSFLDHKSSSSSTTTWEKREVNQEELTATCLCAPIIPLYPSTTFALLCTSSQRCTSSPECTE